MELMYKIVETNRATFGTMSDRDIQKAAYTWIETGLDYVTVPTVFQISYKTNGHGKTITAEVEIIIEGVSVGSYDVLVENGTTCQEVVVKYE